MSVKSEALAGGGTPIYVTRFDGVCVPATDYHPVWLDSLADDVTIEGSAMNGVVRGAEAIRSIVTSGNPRAQQRQQPRRVIFHTGKNSYLIGK